LYSGEAGFFSPDEVRLLDDLSIDISLAVEFNRENAERRRAEEALLRTEERYRLIAENTADTISVYDLDLRLVYVSPSVVKLRGYTSQEALAQSLEQMLTPGSLQKARTILGGQLALEQDPNADPSRTSLLELEEYCKDGSTVWVELAASFLRDANYKPTGILTVTRGVTERRRSEEALRKSEQQFRLIAENVADMIAVVDLQGRRIYNSPSYRSILGDPEQLRGTDGFNEIHPDDREKVRKVFQETVQTGAGQRMEYRFLRKDGAVRHI
jgi:PAS domain S-box-containing protein